MQRPRLALFVGYTLVAIGTVLAAFALVGAAIGAFDWLIALAIGAALVAGGLAAVAAGRGSEPFVTGD